MTVMMVGYLGGIFSIGAPDSLPARLLSMIPFTAPFGMMPRIIVGSPSTWEIAVSLAGLVIALVVMILLAAKLYRIGVLMYGQKPSLRSLFKSGVIRTAR
jgi:ABC-2 type transport system permease protein